MIADTEQISTAAPWDQYISELVLLGGVSDIFFSERLDASYFQHGKYLPIKNAFGETRTFESLRRTVFNGTEVKLGLTAMEPAIEINGKRFRVSYARTLQGEEFVLRYLPTVIPSPEDLLLPTKLVDEFLSIDSGLMLVGGQMGSGKSTTVSSLLKAWSERHMNRIVTFEDPIEYVLPSAGPGRIGSRILQREVNAHCVSFAQGVKEALRGRFKVIVVGEVRDPETAEICLRAALSGHLVVATIHAEDVPTLVSRFLAELPTGRQAWGRPNLASALRIAVVQKLVINEENGKLVGLHEVAFNRQIDHPAIGAWIRAENQSSGGLYNAMSNHRADGMQTFGDAIKERTRHGVLPHSFAQSMPTLR